VGLRFLVRLRFALRSLAVWRVRAIAPSFVFGWQAFSSVSLCENIKLCQYIKPYAQLVGSLLHLSGCTRPDISRAVGALSRHMAHPTAEHWAAAKDLLRYVKGTAALGITYGEKECAVGYGDADFAGCLDTRRSTTGVVFLVHRGAVA
jgi:hypothetical protein